jgi:hypothetical protein
MREMFPSFGDVPWKKVWVSLHDRPAADRVELEMLDEGGGCWDLEDTEGCYFSYGHSSFDRRLYKFGRSARVIYMQLEYEESRS